MNMGLLSPGLYMEGGPIVTRTLQYIYERYSRLTLYLDSIGKVSLLSSRKDMKTSPSTPRPDMEGEPYFHLGTCWKGSILFPWPYIEDRSPLTWTL
jgi:hypothetical protein